MDEIGIFERSAIANAAMAVVLFGMLACETLSRSRRSVSSTSSWPKNERSQLAAALNTLLASPTFASWRQGATLDIGSWLTPHANRTPPVVVSVAHLDDEERALVLGVLLEEVLSWVRSLRGSQRLRALPLNPPTKRPLVALMKQARAYGVGILLATQNPMDLDYRTLSNAGLWCVGRLQTDADRERVLDGLGGSGSNDGPSKTALANVVKKLASRWFLMRDAHARDGREPHPHHPSSTGMLDMMDQPSASPGPRRHPKVNVANCAASAY